MLHQFFSLRIVYEHIVWSDAKLAKVHESCMSNLLASELKISNTSAVDAQAR